MLFLESVPQKTRPHLPLVTCMNVSFCGWLNDKIDAVIPASLHVDWLFMFWPGFPLDMLRCESLLGLDQATCSRVLNKNYKLLVSMAPLSNEIRPISSCTPQVGRLEAGGEGEQRGAVPAGGSNTARLTGCTSGCCRPLTVCSHS